MKKRILLIEDDTKVCDFINQGLTEAGFEVSIAFNGNQGVKMATAKDLPFDLLILDIMLPDKNGIEICAEVRKTDTKIPILFLTALGSTENIALGLNSGGDDYLTKPFKFIELIARINSLLRRSSDSTMQAIEDRDIFHFSCLELNNTTKTLKINKKPVKLTYTEYKLMLVFIQSPNKVFSQPELLEKVWGMDYDIGTNVVNVYVNYLRKKIEKAGSPRVIQTVIGLGYVLKEE
ncbi:response regulator transcription factor [Salegentibacter sp. Hel_I_6]|uniref:response regulator transcription factor n=1 Tax=Salegentibacter sp. Hel_I_6 TaxID=1250278 RepID=UPI00055D876A|nr:response regulator transcription factor [Salegentibacter sp. Hel_I_6]